MKNISTNKDPVCGMTLDEKTVEYKSIHENNVYYFCSATCQNEFDENPEKYPQQALGTHHASHYGAVCPAPGCGARAARGLAWYFYIGLLLLLVLFLVFVGLGG